MGLNGASMQIMNMTCQSPNNQYCVTASYNASYLYACADSCTNSSMDGINITSCCQKNNCNTLVTTSATSTSTTTTTSTSMSTTMTKMGILFYFIKRKLNFVFYSNY